MVKSASFINIKYCPNCGDPHVVLFDENQEPFAEAVLSGKVGLDFIEAMKLALRVSMGRGDNQSGAKNGKDNKGLR